MSLTIDSSQLIEAPAILQLDEGVDSSSRHSCMIRMKVTDNGIGISEHEITNVFSLFWCSQEPESMSLNPTGNGIGLYICKKICESLGGSIAVTSNVG